MAKTKEQQADSYANERAGNLDGYYVIYDAFIAGHAAGEQSMWIKVDADNPQTLPKVDQTVLCCLSSEEFIVARFDHIESHELNGKEYNEAEWWIEDGCDSYTLGDEVIYWMPITPIPYINTEKI
ncbi:MAG: hypothetical protein J5995_08565 [Muribaculaceae bacterium]|nr:hypothetical protein [Muribaculaceae bacterium]